MSTETRRYRFNEVVIWGASESGKDCFTQLAALGIKVAFFVDRAPPPSGVFCDRTVISADQFLDGACLGDRIDAIFLAMGIDLTPIRARLSKAGFSKPVIGFRIGGKVEVLLTRRISTRNLLDADSPQQGQALLQALGRQLLRHSDLLIMGEGAFHDALVSAFPALANAAIETASTVFIAALKYLDIHDGCQLARARWPSALILTPYTLLAEIPDELIPSRAWRTQEHHIYPIEIPQIAVAKDLDMLLLDLPARFLGLLPNGLGYVHEILKRSEIRFETLDMDMICYHRFHATRLIDGQEATVSAAGYAMQSDPWGIDVVEDEWAKDEVLSYFDAEFDRLIQAIGKSRPKLIGFSLHGTNMPLLRRILPRIKLASPQSQIIVGGFDCLNPEVGPRVFSDFDYMVIFEAEGSLDTLVKQLLAGKTVRNLPGVIGKHDVTGFPFIPAPLIEDLDTLGFPKYEWASLDLYRNYNGYQLIPVVLSRGCKWSRCSFCGERFHWRRRSAGNMVDELQWFAEQGCHQFHFNDSDLSGDPTTVREICEEIIRRKLPPINMIGQLRVQKGYTPDYFQVLRRAGFTNLRYGIDGWAKNTLKLHKKGYTLQMIEEVLEMTKAAGIRVSINLVIGIPNETEADIDETIENMLSNAHRFDCIENVNTLLLLAGSVYWEAPEAHGIIFHEPKEELIRRHPRIIPVEFWHSENPYIDQEIRLARLDRIVKAARSAGIRIGEYADRSIRKLNEADDSPNVDVKTSGKLAVL